MKTYKVMASLTSYVYHIIEAKNDDEAWEIARKLDGDVFEDSGYGSWDIDSVEEVI